MRFVVAARSPVVAGVVAMLGALAIGLGWRLITGQPTPTEIVGGRLVLLIPGDLFEVGISALGPLAKRLLLALLVVGQLGIGGGVASGLSRWARVPATASLSAFAAIARSSGALLVVGVVLTFVLAGGDTVVQAFVPLLIAAVAFGLGLELIQPMGPSMRGATPGAADVTTPQVGPATGRSERDGHTFLGGRASSLRAWIVHAHRLAGKMPALPGRTSSPADHRAAVPRQGGLEIPLSRRGLLVTGLGVGAVGVAVAITRRRDQLLATTATAGESRAELPALAPEPPTTPLAPAVDDPTAIIPDGVVSEITSNADFYKVSRAILSDPVLDVQSWRLSVTGQVNRPMAFTLDDLRALPATERQHTLSCISNQVGGNLISNGTWKGIRLADILTTVGMKPGARQVIFHGADFYDDSVTATRAVDPDLLLVYEMNGVPLPLDHGFPLRALVPNIYGIKNVKWLTGIEVVDTDFTGYWEYGGWSDRAAIKTMSRVDVVRATAAGQPVTIGGIAFAGQRGISEVEISVDRGKTWLRAQVERLNQANVWTRWVASWSPATPGPTHVLVRATDGRVELQTSTDSAPFPDGSSGWHGIDIQFG